MGDERSVMAGGEAARAGWVGRLLALVVCCAGVVFSGCAGPRELKRGGVVEPAAAGWSGRLLIIGGGLRNDNVEVWRVFADAAGAAPRIGVIPTASGLPEAGATTATDIRTHLPRAMIDVIDIREESAHLAHDAEVVERIRACNVLWFTGGDQSRITAVFRPEGSETPAYAAVREVLQRGGVIAGTSAGAAMMSDPMITGGRGESALRAALGLGVGEGGGGEEGPAGSRRSAPGIGPGMGLFPYGLTDQHFLRRARLGRLIVAMHGTGQMRGYGIADNRAILVDLGSHSIRPIGEDALVLVDLSRATFTGDAMLDVRLSLLSTGDRVDGRTGMVLRAVEAGPPREMLPREAFADPFGPDAVKHAMHAAMALPGEAVTLTDEEEAITFTFTARGGLEPVRLDVIGAAVGGRGGD